MQTWFQFTARVSHKADLYFLGDMHLPLSLIQTLYRGLEKEHLKIISHLRNELFST